MVIRLQFGDKSPEQGFQDVYPFTRQAVMYTHPRNFTLYEPGFFQFLQMLAHGGPAQWDDIRNISGYTGIASSKVAQYG